MLSQIERAFAKQKQFVSDASHELRTPIAIMQGYLDILDDWGKDDKALLDESIDAMKEETQHMKRLIENLLFLARADQDRLPMEIVDIQLDKLLKKLTQRTKMIAGDRKVCCFINKPLIIAADYELILQMLRALLENSIKYSDAQSGKIYITLSQQATHAVIEICDNGKGIPPDAISHVFDRFYRVAEARAKDSGGSGLGLAMVKKIVDLHYGKIEVDSTLGKGTKMSVYLPTKTL